MAQVKYIIWVYTQEGQWRPWGGVTSLEDAVQKEKELGEIYAKTYIDLNPTKKEIKVYRH